MHVTLYFDTNLPVRKQVAILDGWLKKMGSDEHEKHYHIYQDVARHYYAEYPNGVRIDLLQNPTYLESWMDYDLFHNMLEYNDDALNLPETESEKNIAEVLRILWEASIPTFVLGYEEYTLPFNGGIDGPVSWPQSGQ